MEGCLVGRRRVLYLPYTAMQAGPFKYIEAGLVRGLEGWGSEVKVWSERTVEGYAAALEEFAPHLVLGYLRGGSPVGYRCSRVFEGDFLSTTLAYRQRSGSKVALFTHPEASALRAFLDLEISPDDVSGAYQYYHAPSPPLAEEAKLVEAGAVDLILHTFSQSVQACGFDWWKGAGVPVHACPLAADDSVYYPIEEEGQARRDLCFIGGWWPFKGMQMDRFLKPAKKLYGERLEIYGRNWPYGGEGELDDALFNEYVCTSKINLCFHEPSQVQGRSLHVNERVFKIAACGGFFMCDRNPCLEEYFGDAVVTFTDFEDFVEKVEFYLARPEERAAVSQRCREIVMKRHTYKERARELSIKLNL